MTKRQLIDEIAAINRTASPEFLADFEDTQLSDYLEHLRVIGTSRLSGDPHRYDKYFKNCPSVEDADPVSTRERAGGSRSRRRPRSLVAVEARE